MERVLAPDFIIGSRLRGYARWIPDGPSNVENEAGRRYEIYVIAGNPWAEIEKECSVDKRTDVQHLKWFTILVSKGLKPVWDEGAKLYGGKSRNSKIILRYVGAFRGRKKIRHSGRHHGCTAVYVQRNEPFWAVIAYAERPLEKNYKVVKEQRVVR